LGPLAKVFDFVQFFISILFALVIIRLISELAVAVFRINDNLSPDGGKSELADIDPVAEARKAAEMAAARTREATKTVSEKASAATKSVRDNVDDMADTVQAKAKSATASVREKTAPASETTKADPKSAAAKVSPATAPKKRGRPAGSKNKPKTTAAKPAASKATPKKRGRPAGSTNKKPAAKTTKSSTGGKRGPKPGTKVPRDADGNLLKKDGTPRKKPGPKKS
jgi:histone H1/5